MIRPISTQWTMHPWAIRRNVAAMDPIADLAVDARGVSHSYGAKVAVHPLELLLTVGETVALLGRNGAGKSTLIDMMVGLIPSDTGSLSVDGLSPRQAVARGRIAVMLQDTGFMPGVRVGELVRLGERSYRDALPTAEALRLADLVDLADRRVDRLSGGQAQRLRFALAIVANPRILVLDEPTRALDVTARAEFWTTMRRLAGDGRTILFATHYLDEVVQNAARVVVMDEGRIIADGTPDEMRAAGAVATVRFSSRETIDPGSLRALPGVESLEVRGDTVILASSDSDATVRALSLGSVAWHGLEVAPPSLDSIFRTLTDHHGREDAS
ncbi:MAG: transporter ATP-binding subunit [Frondihabitans sp.]|nr:transporter ATP-binding subunit [Frondihabitans sp.]